MKKNNKAVSQRGLKRHMKNVSRKRRADELKKFNNLVAYFKWVQAMREQQQKQVEAIPHFEAGTVSE